MKMTSIDRLLLMLTGVARVAVDYRKPTQRDLETVTASEIDVYRREGQFAEGSMGPKVEAAIRFLERGGDEVVICRPEALVDAFEGKAGTVIVREES